MGIGNSIIDSVVAELKNDANGYISFDANDLEVGDPLLTFTDGLLAEFADKTTKLELSDSAIYNTIGLAVKVDDKIIEITDSVQDNGVDYREVYFVDSCNGEGNIASDHIVLR